MGFLQNLANSVGRDVSSLFHGNNQQKQQQPPPQAPPPQVANVPQMGVPMNGGGFHLNWGTIGRDLGGAFALTNRVENSAGLGVGRALIGAGQGLSGLVDLASPGTGTSRVSQYLNQAAKNIDNDPRAKMYGGLPYKIGQGLGEAAQYATGEGVAKAAITGAKGVPVLGSVLRAGGNVTAPISTAIDGGIQSLNKGNVAQKAAATFLQHTASVPGQLSVLANTARTVGENASKGGKTTPLSVGTNVLTNELMQGGVPTLMRGGQYAVGHPVNTLRNLGISPPTNLSRAELEAATKVRRANQGWGSTMDLTANDMAHFHNAQLKLGAQPGTPAGYTAVDKALAAHRVFDDAVARRKGNLAQAINDVKGRLQDLPIGMSMKDVSKGPTLAELRSGLKEIHNAATDHLLLQNPERDIPKEIRSQGGISSSAYEDVPKSLIRKNGMSGDKMAQVLGFKDEGHMMNAVNEQKPILTRGQAKAQALQQLKDGTHPFAEDYQAAQKALNDRIQGTQPAKPQLPTPQGSAVTGKTADPFGDLINLKTPEDQLTKPETAPVPAEPAKAAEPTQSATPPKQALSAAPSKPSKLNADSYANVFGVSKDTATKDLSSSKLTATQKAELPPKEQMALHGADTPLRSAEENRALNPVKSDLQHIEQGNHNAAIAQGQQVFHDVQLHGSQVLTAFDKLSHDEKSNFFRSVEKLPANASDNLKEAIARWRHGDNTIHAHSQSDFLGGNTNYIQDHALHSWDLPEDYGQMEHAITGGGKNFQGLNNMARTHPTIEHGEAHNLTLRDNPKDVRKQIESYFGASAHALKKEALRKGLTEADAGEMTKKGGLTLGPGDAIPLSDKGAKAARGVHWDPKSNNLVIRGYRKLNRGATSVLLTHTGVHELNITSRAAPGLALKGHPIAAIKAAAGGVRGNFDKAYVDRIKQQALEDGTASKAAKIGAAYSEGKGLLDRQLTPIHDQVVRSVIADLEKKNIPLDSQAARNAGKAAAGMMGQVNYELAHVPPKISRLLGDVFLAKQFTPSKFMRLGQAATDTGLGGHYARATLVGNAAVATATIAGLGYVFKQKSDSTRDALLRALVDPSVATPMKDAQGNNQQLKLLGTDSSDVSKLLGIKLVRNSDGHLGVSWDPKNLPGTVADYFRSRLAPGAGDLLKIATNQNYANKPLYDPNAPLGTQAIQAATTLGVGHLPIPAQALAYSNLVKSHAPGSAQTILNANTPKANVLQNAALGIVGGTLGTDKTTGKGLQATQYYNAMDQAKQGLNAQEQAAMQMVTGSKKNPVTGQYDVAPTPDDSRAKATALLQNPTVIDHLMAMNQTLAKQGQAVDPLWLQNKDTITKYFQGQAMPPGGPDKIQWQADNKSWYDNLAQARTDFFNKLPPGDPNKPKSPLQYPTATPDMQKLETQFFALQPKDQAAMIKAHPELLTQFQQQHDYTNALRKAQGYDPLKGPPQASARVNNLLNAIPQGSDPASKKAAAAIFADPEVAAYMQNQSEYSLSKNAALDQFQGNSLNQKALKATQQIGNYDLVKNPDGTLALNYGSTGGVNSAIQAGAKGVAYNKFGAPGRKMHMPKGSFKVRNFAGKAGGRKQFATPKLSTSGKIGATRMKTTKSPTAYKLSRKKVA